MTKSIKEITKEDVLQSTGGIMAGLMFNIGDASYIRITSPSKNGGTSSIWLCNPDKGNYLHVVNNREEAEHLSSLVPEPMNQLTRTVAILMNGSKGRSVLDKEEGSVQ